jgi:hypothetical protein
MAIMCSLKREEDSQNGQGLEVKDIHWVSPCPPQPTQQKGTSITASTGFEPVLLLPLPRDCRSTAEALSQVTAATPSRTAF